MYWLLQAYYASNCCSGIIWRSSWLYWAHTSSHQHSPIRRRGGGCLVFQGDAASHWALQCFLASPLLRCVDYKQPAGSEPSLAGFFFCKEDLFCWAGRVWEGKPFTLPKAVMQNGKNPVKACLLEGQQTHMQPEWRVPDKIIRVVISRKSIPD